jgi:hypothetical protein
MKREHRANDEPCLIYWRHAAAGADISPLRDRAGKSDRIRSFIDSRDDGAFRRNTFGLGAGDARQVARE